MCVYLRAKFNEYNSKEFKKGREGRGNFIPPDQNEPLRVKVDSLEFDN